MLNYSALGSSLVVSATGASSMATSMVSVFSVVTSSTAGAGGGVSATRRLSCNVLSSPLSWVNLFCKSTTIGLGFLDDAKNPKLFSYWVINELR